MLSAFAAEHPGPGGRLADPNASVLDQAETEIIDGDGNPDRGDGETDPYAPRVHASSLLRRRLEGLRAWEGATA
jgi:hypothetical protein